MSNQTPKPLSLPIEESEPYPRFGAPWTEGEDALVTALYHDYGITYLTALLGRHYHGIQKRAEILGLLHTDSANQSGRALDYSRQVLNDTANGIGLPVGVRILCECYGITHPIPQYSRARMPFSKKEDALIIQLVNEKHSDEEIASILKRNLASIRVRRKKHVAAGRLPEKSPTRMWTDREADQLIAFFKANPINAEHIRLFARKADRTSESVRNKIKQQRKLGMLPKPDTVRG